MEEYTANLSSDGIVSAQILLSRADFADKRRYQNAAWRTFRAAATPRDSHHQ